MRIGVISDTHGLLRPEALAALAGADHVIHAGDIGGPDIVPRLRAVAPTTAILGNVDAGRWTRDFRDRELVTLAGWSVHVLHDLADLDLDPAVAGIDVVVSGHSHRPRLETIAGALYLNPGSAGPHRFGLPVTLATLDLTPTGLRPEIRELL